MHGGSRSVFLSYSLCHGALVAVIVTEARGFRHGDSECTEGLFSVVLRVLVSLWLSFHRASPTASPTISRKGLSTSVYRSAVSAGGLTSSVGGDVVVFALSCVRRYKKTKGF